ncbi:MAG: PEGA domain-containing protein [Deltaproteobacteria bacterium]|nr:PEGA domain-containing protein [Deltaproteobacteria bacterium]
MMRKIACIALALALAGPAAAQSEDDVAQAKRLFEAGGAAYAQGRYGEAIRALEAAYRFYPDPAVAFSLAQACRRGFFEDRAPARLLRALELYRVYLREAPRGGRREDAVDQIQQLEALRLRVEAPPPAAPAPTPTELLVYSAAPGATASVDGAPPAPVPALVAVSPGAHEVRVEAPGFDPAALSAEAVEARMTPVTVPLSPRPGRVTVETAPGAELYVDGRAVGQAPLAAPLALAPGPHRMDARRSGAHPAGVAVEVPQDGALTVQLPLRTTTQRKVAFGLLGAGAGLVALGATSAGLAVHFQGQADLGTPTENLEPEDGDAVNQALDRRDGFRAAAGALLGVGAAAALTGGLLYLLDVPEAPVGLALGPQGVVAVGRF